MRYVILKRSGDNTALNERLVSEDSHQVNLSEFPIKVMKEEQMSNPVINNPVTTNPVNEPPSTVRDPTLIYLPVSVLSVESEQDLKDVSKYVYREDIGYVKHSELNTRKYYKYKSFEDYVAKGNKEIFLYLPERENQHIDFVEQMTMGFNVDNLVKDLTGFTFHIMQNQYRLKNSGHVQFKTIPFYGHSKILDMIGAINAIANIPKNPLGNSDYFINDFAGLPSPPKPALIVSSINENIFKIHHYLSNDNLYNGLPAYKLFSFEIPENQEIRTGYFLIYKPSKDSLHNNIIEYNGLGVAISGDKYTKNLEIPERYLAGVSNLTLVYDYTKHDYDRQIVRSVQKIGNPVVYIPDGNGGFKLYE